MATRCTPSYYQRVTSCARELFKFSIVGILQKYLCNILLQLINPLLRINYDREYYQRKLHETDANVTCPKSISLENTRGVWPWAWAR